MGRRPPVFLFFFFNDTATTEIYTLSLHDALPIYRPLQEAPEVFQAVGMDLSAHILPHVINHLMLVELGRSEEHTSELQSLAYLVCRLLLEKKKDADIHGVRPTQRLLPATRQHHRR